MPDPLTDLIRDRFLSGPPVMTAAEARNRLAAAIRVKLAEAHEHGRVAGRNGADAASPPAHVTLEALADILGLADFYAGCDRAATDD
jgi:hypothetical protein